MASEFTGRTQKNTIYPEVPDVQSPAGNPAAERDQMSAQDELRLVYLTGQDDDSTLPPDPRTFNGETHKDID